MVPGTNQLSIAGQVASHANMDGYTKRFDIGMGEWGHHHTEWIHMQGHRDLSGTVTLQAQGAGADFKVVPVVSYQFGGVAVDNDSIGGGANVLNAFEGTFTGSTTAERLQSQQQGMVNSLQSWLDQVLRSINLDLSHHMFIPPGGAVLTFQSPRFTSAGDLLFSISY